MRKQRDDSIDALQLSQKHFQAIWNAAADAMVLSDADGIVVAANLAYFELYGYSPDEVLQKSFAVIFPVEQRDSAVEQYKAIFASRSIIPSYESIIRRADGSERTVESHATFITLPDNQIALLSIIRDITIRKHLEAERDSLLLSERDARIAAEHALRTRDQFLAIAAHELKTPLTILLGHTSVLRRRAEREQLLSERNMRALRVINLQGFRLNILIHSLLDIERIQEGNFTIDSKPLDLCALIRQLVEELQLTLDLHTIQLECREDPLIINADAGRLEQVIQNLLQNAVKYSPTGGIIRVIVGRREDIAYFSVSDQGIGIPEVEQPHLFHQFYRAVNGAAQHIEGLGIGLYVSKEIVQRHGGRITLVSREGEGSTFTVLLPLTTADSPNSNR